MTLTHFPFMFPMSALVFFVRENAGEYFSVRERLSREAVVNT